MEALREMLKQACVASPLGVSAENRREDLTEKLSESERLVKEMSQTWEEKLRKTGEGYATVVYLSTLLDFSKDDAQERGASERNTNRSI